MQPTRVTRDGDRLVVEPAPGVNLEELKEMGGRWDGARARMALPASLWVLEALNDALGDVEADTNVLALRETPQEGGAKIHSRWADLLDFQRPRVERLVGTFDAGYGRLLAMSPGLGKTIVSIVAADVVNDGWTTMVVCPASLVPNWHREIEVWSEYPDDWRVMSYEAFVRDRATLAEEGPWPHVIVDESIMIKSHNAKRTKALHEALTARGKPHKGIPPRFVGRAWLLSGSPIARYPDDLWAQLHMTRPKAFPSYWRFAERYCWVRPSDWGPGKVVTGPRARHDAKLENADLMEVVDQASVINLPEYLFEVIDVPLSSRQLRAYETMMDHFTAELATGELTAENKGARLTRLQQIVAGMPGSSAKHDALLELVEAGSYETPMLVWTHWKGAAEALYERLSKIGSAAYVNGDTPPKRRDKALEAFKAGELDFLVLSLGVGKFGHTFTKTKTVVYVDKTFAADDYVQSLRRVRRIGLGHRPVVVTLHSPGTTDDLVERNLEGKLGSIARMTDGDLRELLMGLGKETT